MGGEETKGGSVDKNIVMNFESVPQQDGYHCQIEDGKIKTDFRHFKDEYKKLETLITKSKNELKMISGLNEFEILNMKGGIYKKQTTDEETQSKISVLLENYENSVKFFNKTLNDLKGVYKRLSVGSREFFVSWLKKQVRVDVTQQLNILKGLQDEFKEISDNFIGFELIYKDLTEILPIQINTRKEDELNKIYDDNKEEISKFFNFNGNSEFRSIVNYFQQIKDQLTQKEHYLHVFKEIFNMHVNLQIKVLNSISEKNPEMVDIVNELNEFNGVIVYHVLIRGMEEKLKLMSK